MLSFSEQFIVARRKGVPLIGIESSDPGATMKRLREECCEIPKKAALVLWNSASGVAGYNGAGSDKIAATLNSNDEICIPQSFLIAIADESIVPNHTIIVMQAATDWLDKPVVRQAIWNLRDKFKRRSTVLVLLSEVIQLPLSLKNDMTILRNLCLASLTAVRRSTPTICCAGSVFLQLISSRIMRICSSFCCIRPRSSP